MARAPVAEPAVLAERRGGLRSRVAEAGAAALLVTSLPNVRYLTGFTGSAGVLAIGSDGPDLLFTDGRYRVQAVEEADAAVEIEIVSDGLLGGVRDRLGTVDYGEVLFESDHWSVAQWDEWRQAGGSALEGVRGWVEEMRAVKSAAERDAIARAAAVVDRTFEAILPGIRAGVAERELAVEVDRRLVAEGSDRPAFETIVAFGERAALPHARPGARALARGEVVLLDFGAVVDGYASDLSRTVALGDPGNGIRDAYGVVLEAQAAALEEIRGGATGREVDAAARRRIEAAGEGERFPHSVGHGLGLEVHERPRLSRTSDDVLAAGMVVTVEPGIYIPGLGGVRIEDDAVVGDDGAEVLTRAPKDSLLVL